MKTGALDAGGRLRSSGVLEAPELEAQIRTLRAELDWLGAALLATDEKPQVVVKMIAEGEKRVASLEARLTATRIAPSVLDLEVRRPEKQARSG
ncbi:hypothetical protein BE17_45555 [Sorangium cellulosum]|uniref:Uncharacterized protein n=1 Tax=Sorangium cellulosum TaxID=56 RepID=A0A150RKW1_SORCE|nr:hypothetical protein BE17_45555 [Sorangium cellulosum]